VAELLVHDFHHAARIFDVVSGESKQRL
jgi:hypothetical protein